MTESGCVLVIGLDGATFKVLGPLMDAGKMPNLARIRDQGASGVLMSTVPSLSGPAWTSFFTGLNPGKHGVFSWRRDPRSRDPTNLVSSRTVIGEKLWGLLGKAGLRSCIIGVPVTYPPEEMEGAMVTGVLTPMDAKVFTHPPGLSDELHAMGYRTDYEFKNDDYDGRDETRRALYKEIKELARARIEAAELLLERGPWSLFVVMYGQTDQVQHFFWDDQEVLTEFFGIMDDHIGRLVEAFSKAHDRLHVLVMSDHGFDASPTKSFALNKWLKEEGFEGGSEKKARSRTFEAARKVSRSLKKVGIDLGKTKMGKKRFEKESKKALDTKMVVLEGQGLYIDREQAGDGLEDIKRRLSKRLGALKDPDGNKVFKAVYTKEEVYKGEADSEGMKVAPDVAFVPMPEYYIDPAMFSDKVFDTHGGGQGRSNWTGMHNGSPEGVIFMTGPDVRKGAAIEEASIMDITPTVLYLLDLEVPAAVDGKVLKTAFGPDVLKKRKVRVAEKAKDGARKERYEYSEEEAKDVERRLKSLGYLD
jgi:predicted AlkP superfamily phosphohydrolase/phosphomutase